jgi:hypothetical protein
LVATRPWAVLTNKPPGTVPLPREKGALADRYAAEASQRGLGQRLRRLFN